MVAPAITTPSLYHWLPLTDVELSVTLPPEQNVVALPALIVGADGIAVTVTTIALDGDDEHPLTVTTHV